ncbi:MAG: vWA domain-containing protein [Bradymonadia bacterium]
MIRITQRLGLALLLLNFACGEDNAADTLSSACGECPPNHACVASSAGTYCQSQFTRSEEDEDDNALPAVEPTADEPSPPRPTTEVDDETETDVNTPGAEQAPACQSLNLHLKPSQGSIPRVMLVVDRSYSMIVEEDRWSPIEETLSRVTESLSDTVHFGLVLFPSPNANVRGSEAEMACAEGEINVSPAANTATDIQDWLTQEPPQPGLATPTYSALDAAGRALLAQPTGNDYILLATDGGPGCNFGLDVFGCTCLNHSCLLGLPEMCLDDQRTVNKVRDLAAEGIKTIVLGISSDDFMPESRRVLDHMAQAGQTATDGRHFEVNRVDDLEQSLTAAAGQLAPCRYDLGALAGLEDDLNVVIDGTDIERDQNRSNGFDIVDGELEFFGDACAMLRDGQAHQISASCQ